jgi:CRISPR-associated protein Cas1
MNYGIIKPELRDLPVIRDRISFLYAEQCKINRKDGAVTFTDENGISSIPAAAISVLMLGPGTDISHRAVELISTAGSAIIWVGEQGVRYYAHGQPVTHSSSLLIRQAALVSNVQSRAKVVRTMYEMRFPDEDVSDMTIQQLRGKEGTRVKNLYRKYSLETGVPWNGRTYDPDAYDDGDTVNKSLSSGNSCLYGVCHSVIAALGLAPGLGFVHNGHERAFVYDLADLYKAEITIPLAFKIASEYGENDDVSSVTRREVRNKLSSGKILARCVKDIHTLLNIDFENKIQTPETDFLTLWDNKSGTVQSHKSYGEKI